MSDRFETSAVGVDFAEAVGHTDALALQYFGSMHGVHRVWTTAEPWIRDITGAVFNFTVHATYERHAGPGAPASADLTELA